MGKCRHIYRGIRMLYDRPVNGRYVVTCFVSVDGRPLPMTTCGRQKSPTGFDWGELGSGAAALAHAILTYEVDEQVADEWSQAFKRDVIAKLPNDQGGEEWTLTSRHIHAWLKAQRVA